MLLRIDVVGSRLIDFAFRSKTIFRSLNHFCEFRTVWLNCGYHATWKYC